QSTNQPISQSPNLQSPAPCLRRLIVSSCRRLIVSSPHRVVVSSNHRNTDFSHDKHTIYSKVEEKFHGGFSGIG
ncbi:MAG: hypothetical protein D6794_07405, partial [Deltaproteobacteria bacterium]